MADFNRKIILFSEEKYKGKGLVLFESIDLPTQLHSWKNIAKSLIVVKGKWKLKKNNGDYSVFENDNHQGKYPSPECWREGNISALIAEN